MTDTNNYQDYDIITIIIVLMSCIITTLLTELKCLISPASATSIPNHGKSGGHSKTTKRTSTSKTKSQPRSRSTKPSSGTVDQKKAVGGSRKVPRTNALPLLEEASDQNLHATRRRVPNRRPA